MVARICARWAEDVDIDDYDPDMGGLINRTADNWRPLFVIADAIGSDWPMRIREAAAALAPRESESTGTVLLADIKATFDDKHVDRLASVDICEALKAMEGRPWADWKAGKELTPNQLARLLKPFGVMPDSVRVGNRTPKGYYRSQFDGLWQRYLAAEGVNKTQQRNNLGGVDTSGTSQNATPEAAVAAQNREEIGWNGHCCGVAVQNRDPRFEGANGECCDRCWRAGSESDPLLDVFDGERDARLHRGCLGAWKLDHVFQ